jgi:hypothetical protein
VLLFINSADGQFIHPLFVFPTARLCNEIKKTLLKEVYLTPNRLGASSAKDI